MSRRKRYTRNLGRTLPAPLPRRTTERWIRFEHEREPYGLFSYADDARAALSAGDRHVLDGLVGWFADFLDAPTLSRDAEERFWFRAEASDHVARARDLADLVRRAGIPIVERTTHRVPGKIRWADPQQVAVLTYRDAPRPRRSSR